MARKSLGFVPLIWECPSCGTQNPGPIKTCTSCGAPQPEDVEFLQVDQEKFDFIKDEALIRMAKAGPDIHCPWCGTRNPATAKLCSNCGGELSQGGKPRQTGGRVKSVTEAHARQPEPAASAAKTKFSSHNMIIGVILLVVLCVVGYIIIRAVSKTDEIKATVTDVYWERSINLTEYTEVTQSAWQDEVPADADILSCSQEYRYTSDQPAANATEVCGEAYTVDTGTGVGEVVQDCVYEVYDNFCDYHAWEWVPIAPVIASGYNLSPTWPTLNLTSNQQENDRTESYTIDFQNSKQDYTYSTTDLDLFLQAEPGSEWTLQVNQLGTVQEAIPSN